MSDKDTSTPAVERLLNLTVSLLDVSHAQFAPIDSARDELDEHSPIGWVARTAKPLVIPDTSTKPPPISGFDLGGAWAGCPVLDGAGGVLGVCHVTNATVRNWSVQDGVLLRTLAAAVAAELLAEPSTDWRRGGAVGRYRAAGQSPAVMLWSTTTTGALDHVSEAWLRWRGSTVAAEIGDGWLEGVHPADREASLAAWRIAVENRTSVAGQLRFRKTTGEYAWVLASAVPRYRGDDIFAGYLGYCVDVDEGRRLTEGTAQTVERLTARREATERRAERETMLHSLATALSRAITPEEVAATALAHIGATLGADGAAFVLRVPRSDRAYVAASSGTLQIDSNSLRQLSGPVGDLLRDVMEHHEPVWPSPGARGSDRTLACVPLMWSRHCLGAVTIGLGNGWLSDDEKGLITSVVRRCTEALQRSRLYAVEHEIAETLQHNLLPASLPSPHGVRIFAKYRASDLPGRVGGDWYESIELSPELVWLSVGDVVGQGPRAAAVMAQLRSALQGFAIQQGGPATALADLSRLAEKIPGALASTTAACLFDLKHRRLTYASAGHPPPMLLPARGEPRFLWEGRRPALGIEPGIAANEGTVQLSPHDVIVCYSDGLVERRGELLDVGLRRLAAAARTHVGGGPDELCGALFDAMFADFDAGDDVVIIAARLETVPPLRLCQTAIAENLTQIRSMVGRWLTSTAADGNEITDVTMAVEEATANAVEHAYLGTTAGDVIVDMAEVPGGDLTITVQDFGTWRPDSAPGDRGRGLAIMRALSEDFSIVTNESGTTVRLSVSRDRT